MPDLSLKTSTNYVGSSFGGRLMHCFAFRGFQCRISWLRKDIAVFDV